MFSLSLFQFFLFHFLLMKEFWIFLLSILLVFLLCLVSFLSERCCISFSHCPSLFISNFFLLFFYHFIPFNMASFFQTLHFTLSYTVSKFVYSLVFLLFSPFFFYRWLHFVSQYASVLARNIFYLWWHLEKPLDLWFLTYHSPSNTFSLSKNMAPVLLILFSFFFSHDLFS